VTFAGFVPDYSDGVAADLHRLPWALTAIPGATVKLFEARDKCKLETATHTPSMPISHASPSRDRCACRTIVRNWQRWWNCGRREVRTKAPCSTSPLGEADGVAPVLGVRSGSVPESGREVALAEVVAPW